MLFLFSLFLYLITATSAAAAEPPRMTPAARWVPAAAGDENGPYFLGYIGFFDSTGGVTCMCELSSHMLSTFMYYAESWKSAEPLNYVKGHHMTAIQAPLYQAALGLVDLLLPMLLDVFQLH
jgi:hypothetical protein